MPEEKDKNQSSVNQPVADFLADLKASLATPEKEEKSEKEEVEETGGSMAKLYERVRNLIEYKDDHLIKRNAIERILKRNLIIESRQQNFADQFLNELVMSGYLERAEINDELKKRIAKIIEKYQKAVRSAGRYETKKWLVAMASCEIEEKLFPNPARYSLVRAMYQTVRERIVIKNGNFKGGERDIQIFLSCLKSITKLDNATLNYSLLKIYAPEWFSERTTERELEKTCSRFPGLAASFKKKIEDPLSVKIGVALRRYAVYFNIFFETALTNIDKIDKIVANPESLKFASQLSVDDVYSREMNKFRKRVRRSLVFLIITKIVLAVGVEYPYDLFLHGQVNFFPIYINLLFPPLYLMFLSSTIKRPSSENSTLIAKGIEEIVYNKKENPIAIINMREVRTFSDQRLNIFFLITYGISFGLVTWILRLLHFNWFGVLIFLFLFSVVSFFNALVRQPIRELLIAREKEGMVGMLIDTLSMPFVRIGKWMSVNFSRVNVFIFLFDVIIEAPFKVVVRFIQQWSGFIRRKKEEEMI